MTISYSELDTYLRCPRKHQYKYVENLRHPGWSKSALHLGTMYHKLQAARVNGDYEVVLEESFIEAREHPDPDKAFDMVDLVAQAHNLVDRWVFEYEEDFLVEQVAETTLESDGWSGTPDLTYLDDNTERFWIRDYKSTSFIPFKPPMDFQPYLYMWLAYKLGKDVAGFEYDYIRTKEPTLPRVKKDGSGIAYLNTIDTTPELLVRAMIETGLSKDPDHLDRYRELQESGNLFFQRYYLHWREEIHVPLVEEQLSIWGDRIRKDITKPLALRSWGLDNCTKCEYTELCTALLTGDYQDKRKFHVDTN